MRDSTNRRQVRRTMVAEVKFVDPLVEALICPAARSAAKSPLAPATHGPHCVWFATCFGESEAREYEGWEARGAVGSATAGR